MTDVIKQVTLGEIRKVQAKCVDGKVKMNLADLTKDL
jgi:hypothetical protein